MPRINRLRIVGLRYDGMRKRYEDQTFDFNDGQEAVHTLIAFMNGGGKGVLLQTLFQIMIPGTSWGEKDNRLYQQFFYNDKEKFIPYVFHVLVEWELDGGAGYLISGGVFSAERQTVLSDDEERQANVVPKYTMYTKVCDIDDAGLFPLLVLTDYDETIKRLKEARFETYERLKRYFELLVSYGIDRKDWDILKEINKNEGGIGKYFEKAEDDPSLWRNKIVPAVSLRLKQQPGMDDLVEIFKSNLSIAKNLPILLSREGVHHEFLDAIRPLKKEAGALKEQEQQQKELELEGHKRHSALLHLKLEEEEALANIAFKIEAEKETEEKLRYEKENVLYAKQHCEMVQFEQNITLGNERVSELQQDCDVAKSEEKIAKLSVLARKWQNETSSIEQIDQKIQAMRALAAQKGEEAKQLREMEEESKIAWETLSAHIAAELGRYEHLNERLRENMREHEEKENAALRKSEENKAEIAELKKQNEAYERRFDAYPTKDAAKFLEDAMRSRSDASEKKEIAYDEVDKASYQVSLLHGRLSESQALKQGAGEKVRELQDNILLREEEEERVKRDLSRILQENLPTLGRADATSQVTQLEALVREQTFTLEASQESLWQKQLDLSLSDAEHWVANADLKRLHEELSERVDVFYGTALLRTFSDEVQHEMLSKHPLLPFGLVVSQTEILRAGIHLEEVGGSLQSPVPVFLREAMDKADTSAYVVASGHARTLTLSPVDFQLWRDSAKKTYKEAAIVAKEAETTLHEMREILTALRMLCVSEFADELYDKVNEAQETLTRLEREHAHFLHEKDRAEEASRLTKARFKEAETFLGEKERALNEARTFYEEYQKLKLRKERLGLLETAKGTLEARVAEFYQEGRELSNRREQWHGSYQTWLIQSKQHIETIAEVVNNAKVPLANPLSGEEDTREPQFTFDVYQDCLTKVAQAAFLQKKEAAREQELETLKVEREGLTRLQKVYEDQLVELELNWRDQPLHQEPLGLLEEMSKNANIKRRQVEQILKAQEDNLLSLRTAHSQKIEEVSRLATRIKEEFPTRAADPWPQVNLEVKDNKVRESLSDCRETIRELEEEKEKTDERLLGYGSSVAVIIGVLGIDLPSGAFSAEMLTSIRENPERETRDWRHRRFAQESGHKSLRAQFGQKVRKLRDKVEESEWDASFKRDVLASLNVLDQRPSAMIEEMLSGMIRFSESSLEQLKEDKVQAEKAQAQWANRAAMKVVSISDNIRHMISKMAIKNDYGLFPLVKLERDILPRRAEEIEQQLKDHFATSVAYIVRQFDQLDENNKKLQDLIKERAADAEILFAALGRAYPTLFVYNMTTDNALTYGTPKREYYSSWKTINQGSETKADGSGGQKLAARTIVMMMLLSMKAQTDQHWTTLICDNPLGQAVSAHVLDPIFEVAKKLKFQLIFVSPPELIKTEVSKRFPMFAKLDFAAERGHEKVTQTVQRSFRQYHLS